MASKKKESSAPTVAVDYSGSPHNAELAAKKAKSSKAAKTEEQSGGSDAS